MTSNVWSFCPTPSNSLTILPGCPIIQSSCGTNVTNCSWGLSPTRLPSLQTPVGSSGSRGYSSSDLATNWRFPKPCSGQWFTIMAYRTLLLSVYSKDCYKGYRLEERDEEVHRARSGRSTAQELLSGRVWGLPPSENVDAFANPEALWTLWFMGFMEIPLHRHNWLNHWSLISTSSPFLGDQDVRFNLKLQGLLFWQPAPIWGLNEFSATISLFNT